MKRDPKAVGKRIRQIRTEKLGLSMADFGRRIDNKVQSGTVSNWETGKNLPNNERLKHIANLGDISVSELLYGYSKDHYQHANKLLNELIEKNPNDESYNVSDETKDELLNEVLQTHLASPYVQMNNGEFDSSVVWLIIENKFKEHYYQTVISNKSLINMYETGLYSLRDKINDYYVKSTIATFEVDEDTVFQLMISLESENLNEELLNVLINSLDSLIDKTDDLLKRYPNEKKSHSAMLYFIGSLEDDEYNEDLINKAYGENEGKIKEHVMLALNELISDYQLENTKAEDLYNKYKGDIDSFIKNKPFLKRGTKEN